MSLLDNSEKKMYITIIVCSLQLYLLHVYTTYMSCIVVYYSTKSHINYLSRKIDLRWAGFE